jgi:hypothetical protein
MASKILAFLFGGAAGTFGAGGGGSGANTPPLPESGPSLDLPVFGGGLRPRMDSNKSKY